MIPAFERCESHPGRLLTEHLLAVGGRLEDPLLKLAGLCHDLGKATEFFQRALYGEPVPPALREHALMGAEILLELAVDKFPAEQVSLAYGLVRRHHGGLDNLADSVATLGAGAEEVLARQKACMDWHGMTRWLAGLGIRGRPCSDTERAHIRRETRRALKARMPAEQRMARFLSALGAVQELRRADTGGYRELPSEWQPVLALAGGARPPRRSSVEVILSDAAERVRRDLEETGAASCLVVMNTVPEALAAYHELAKWAPAHRLFHYSENLRPVDRERILREIAAKTRCIVTATPLVDWVDLAFERVYRAPAPAFAAENDQRKILDSIKKMEFATLRKMLRNDLVPHFVELDDADREAFHSGDTEGRVVEVPRLWARSAKPDPRTGLVYVDRARAGACYNPATGWKRRI